MNEEYAVMITAFPLFGGFTLDGADRITGLLIRGIKEHIN